MPEVKAQQVEVLDTTLRDGSQQEGLSLSVDDKLRVAEQLDYLGVDCIEGGWPGANPKDGEFFARAKKELPLTTSTLVAFGSTRHPGARASDDEILRNLVEVETETVCIVGKASALQVQKALRTSLDEAVAMAYESVAFLVAQGLRVLFDAEHFFDGYRVNPKFAMRVLRAAEEGGADALVLCDTNGGMLAGELKGVVEQVAASCGTKVGIHCHNDSGSAVANTIAAVEAGAVHVQGCINGYGERTGNADLAVVIPNLILKKEIQALPPGRLSRVTSVSHHIAELVNIPPHPQQPYTGTAAFAHKAGLHTSAIARLRTAYEHVDPETVGNGTRIVVSELAGRSTIALQAEQLGIELGPDGLSRSLSELKKLEYEGYHFEVADGSLELLLRRSSGWEPHFYTVESYRVISEHQLGGVTEATVKVQIGGERVIAAAEGNGPVNALDGALRKAIGRFYPDLAGIHLVDYRVRVLDSAAGTASATRVLIDSTNGDRVWTTIGVSQNIIEASWQALDDSIMCGLLCAGAAPVVAGSEDGGDEATGAQWTAPRRARRR